MAQHPDLPFFQNQRKRATPSRMMMVEPDRITFMCPTWKPSRLIAFRVLPEDSDALGGGLALHMVVLAGERLGASWSVGAGVKPMWQLLLLCQSC